jgi:hypothetical protein
LGGRCGHSALRRHSERSFALSFFARWVRARNADEESLLEWRRCCELHRREIPRLRPAPRIHRAQEKSAGLRSE